MRGVKQRLFEYMKTGEKVRKPIEWFEFNEVIVHPKAGILNFCFIVDIIEHAHPGTGPEDYQEANLDVWKVHPVSEFGIVDYQQNLPWSYFLAPGVRLSDLKDQIVESVYQYYNDYVIT